jgi:CRISPR-associated protein Csd2
MSTRALLVFEHDSALGNAAAHKLFDLVKVERANAEGPARAFEDYRILVDEAALPTGVKLLRKV